MMQCKKILWAGVGLGFLIMNFGGCVTAPSSRMASVLGLPVDKEMVANHPVLRWPNDQTVGLMALSDDSGPNAAPAISSAMLSRLSQRTQVNLGKRCATPEIKNISHSGLGGRQSLSSLIDIAKGHKVESLVIAMFSSTETTEPATFGEARMMTQMPGSTTHNSALVELALIDVDQGVVMIQANGQATESLDRLNAPLGNDQRTNEEALDILRANAGQQALDRALTEFTRGCRNV